MTGVIQEDRERDHRARELYHYFQPDNPALLPTGHCALESIKSPSVVKASPNLVLTALAQLAAVKLQAQRAIIRYLPRCCKILFSATPPRPRVDKIGGNPR